MGSYDDSIDLFALFTLQPAMEGLVRVSPAPIDTIRYSRIVWRQYGGMQEYCFPLKPRRQLIY